jgi:hypothetical protein
MRTRTVTLRLPEQTHLVLQSQAARNGISISERLRELVYADIERIQEADRLMEMEKRLNDKIELNERLIRTVGVILKRHCQEQARV